MPQDISLLQRRKPHMQETYLKKMSRRARNNQLTKSEQQDSILPSLHQANSSQMSKGQRQLYTLIKPGKVPQQNRNQTYHSTPYKAMKSYIDHNYDPFVMGSFENSQSKHDIDSELKIQIRDQNLLTESLDSSLPSIAMNNTDDHRRFMMNTIRSKTSDKADSESNQTRKSTLFTGSRYQYPQEIKKSRQEFFQNIAKNQLVVTPSQEVMQVALDLGMPQFKIIEVPIKGDQRKSKVRKNQNGKQNLKKGGSIELFSNMNKEAIQMIGKRQKIAKSDSIMIRKFQQSNGGSEAEAQLFQNKVTNNKRLAAKHEVPDQNVAPDKRQSKRQSKLLSPPSQKSRPVATGSNNFDQIKEDDMEDQSDETESDEDYDPTNPDNQSSSSCGDLFTDAEELDDDANELQKMDTIKRKESKRSDIIKFDEQILNPGKVDGLMAARQGEEILCAKEIKRELQGFVAGEFAAGSKDRKRLAIGRLRSRYGQQLENDIHANAKEEKILQQVLDTTAHYSKKTDDEDVRAIKYKYQAFQKKYQRAFKEEREAAEGGPTGPSRHTTPGR